MFYFMSKYFYSADFCLFSLKRQNEEMWLKSFHVWQKSFLFGFLKTFCDEWKFSNSCFLCFLIFCCSIFQFSLLSVLWFNLSLRTKQQIFYQIIKGAHVWCFPLILPFSLLFFAARIFSSTLFGRLLIWFTFDWFTYK